MGYMKTLHIPIQADGHSHDIPLLGYVRTNLLEQYYKPPAEGLSRQSASARCSASIGRPRLREQSVCICRE